MVDFDFYWFLPIHRLSVNTGFCPQSGLVNPDPLKKEDRATQTFPSSIDRSSAFLLPGLIPNLVSEDRRQPGFRRLPQLLRAGVSYPPSMAVAGWLHRLPVADLDSPSLLLSHSPSSAKSGRPHVPRAFTKNSSSSGCFGFCVL